MGVEIERKFLLKNDSWKKNVRCSVRIRQGYLAPLSKSSIRVRIEGDKANVNIKSATLGVSRMEYEYPIPQHDAEEMLNSLCQTPQINKVRHEVFHCGHVWEIDEFLDENEGLVVAEVELNSEEEMFVKPEWLAEEVSEDPRYYNVNLIKHPFKNW